MRTRRIKLTSIAFLTAFFFLGCATLSFKSSGNLKPYRTTQLENGLNILYVSDEKLPYLSLSLFFMDGYATDPQGQSGLTSAVFDLLEKGTATQNANQIARQIDQLGAELSIDAGADYSTISLDGLSWHEDQLLNIFSDIILNPKFDESEIVRYKSRTSAIVKQRLDQAANLANEATDIFYYGSHPYARRDIGTLEEIKKLDRKSIQQRYLDVVQPNKAWLVIVGKTSSEMNEKLSKRFASWKFNPSKQYLFPEVQKITGRNILLVNKSDAAQAEIRFVHAGTDRKAADHVATTVANSILGQGFTSRLVDRIRDQLGLTYSIGSGIDFKKHGSQFKIRTFTQNDKVGQMITETLKVYQDFYDKGVTVEELTVAKNYLSGVFPSLVETAEKTALNLMVLRAFGISDDYLLNYQKNIRQVTLEQVNASIRKNFDPANVKIVIVGKKSVIEKQVKDLGELKIVESSSYMR